MKLFFDVVPDLRGLDAIQHGVSIAWLGILTASLVLATLFVLEHERRD